MGPPAGAEVARCIVQGTIGIIPIGAAELPCSTGSHEGIDEEQDALDYIVSCPGVSLELYRKLQA